MMAKEEPSNLEINTQKAKSMAPLISAEHFRHVKSTIRKNTAHHFEITLVSELLP